MPAELTLQATLDRTTAPSIAAPQLIYVLLEVRLAADLPTVRLPLALSLVVDCSRSMRIPILTPEQFETLARRGYAREIVVDGTPVWQFQNVPAELAAQAPRSLDFVKIALRNVLERLEPEDRFSLVAFADQAETLISDESGENKRRLLAALERLDQLALGDDTYMARGIELGYQEAIRSLAPGRVQRMILLTDGFARDEDDCRRQARQAAAQGVAISTVGLGVEFNEELLLGIADVSRGQGYFVQDPQEIPGILAREMERVERVAVREVELKLRLAAGVEVRQATQVQPAIADLPSAQGTGREFSVRLGDLEQGASHALLLELLAPPRAPGVVRLARGEATYHRPRGGSQGQASVDVVIEYAAGEQGQGRREERVLAWAEAVAVHRLQAEAARALRGGDVASAVVKLRATAARLHHLGEEELAQAALQEAERLEQRGQASPAATKRLSYATRRLERAG